MSKKMKLIPVYRFPEFGNKSEWSLTELEDCLDYLQPTSYLVQSTNYNDEFETPVLTAGKSFILGYTNEKEGVFNENLPVIIFDDFTTDSKFVDFPFKTKSSAMKILLAKNGNNIKFVYESMQILNYEVGVHKRHWISDFSKLKIALPTPQEQQKIASCLSSLDEVIAAHNDKLGALKDHKKGLLQNFFPQDEETEPKVRFPEFEGDGEWVEKELSEVAKIITGSTPSTKETEYYGGEIMFVSPADINEIKYVEFTKKTLSKVGYTKTRKIKANSVMFVCIGSTIGKVAMNKYDCATNQQINSLITGIDNSSNFLYSNLVLNAAKIAELAGNQAVPIINKTLFSSVKLMFPPDLKEQQKIASCLSALDELIISQSEKVEQLQKHKNGLMQCLFPKIES